MPTVTKEALESYPWGYFLPGGATEIDPSAWFVTANAADGWKGTGINDPGSYVYDTWAGAVDLAYRSGKPIWAVLTARIAGNKWPIDIENPKNDRQLQGFLYALKNKTYAGIILRYVTEDSPAATVLALNHFKTQLRKSTGKKVSLVITKEQWESHELYTTMVGAVNTDWSLLIVGSGAAAEGDKIYTPGNWGLQLPTGQHPGRALIADVAGRYIMWLPAWWNEQFYGIEFVQEPTEPGEPTPGTPADTSKIEAVLIRIAASLELLVQKVVSFLAKFGD